MRGALLDFAFPVIGENSPNFDSVVCGSFYWGGERGPRNLNYAVIVYRPEKKKKKKKLFSSRNPRNLCNLAFNSIYIKNKFGYISGYTEKVQICNQKDQYCVKGGGGNFL